MWYRAGCRNHDLISCSVSAEFQLSFVQQISKTPTRLRAFGLKNFRFDFVQSVSYWIHLQLPYRRLSCRTTISCIAFWSRTHISCVTVTFQNRKSFVTFGQDSHEFFITFLLIVFCVGFHSPVGVLIFLHGTKSDYRWIYRNSAANYCVSRLHDAKSESGQYCFFQ